ncbi:MAG TPA: DUF1028 domain-containing protein [Gaiella sp.]
MTYSIVAFDEATGARGVAVASKALCVGAHVPWGGAGIGALATQAWHDLRYGSEGFALLSEGLSAAAVVQRLTFGDPDAPHRQLGIVDAENRLVSYTGSRCLPWAGGMCGVGYAVQGNLLAGPQVVEAMAAEYERRRGEPFVHRLVQALLAGDEAGGDRRGRQSAAVRVWRGEPAGLADVDGIADLRIDDSELPVHDLTKLVPRYWLEYGAADEDALPLSGAVRDRVRGALSIADDGLEPELARWASELNLESRLVDGAVDPVVLDILERGEVVVLSELEAALPPTGWPA